MGWFERVKKASAAERVTRSDKRHAVNTWQELEAISAERERMLREGVTGSATIVGIRENVATTALGTWHELALDVEVPHRDPYRATRHVAVELSAAPHIRVGATVPVRIDPNDSANILVVSEP
jgi:hypothetical protein